MRDDDGDDYGGLLGYNKESSWLSWKVQYLEACVRAATAEGSSRGERFISVRGWMTGGLHPVREKGRPGSSMSDLDHARVHILYHTAGAILYCPRTRLWRMGEVWSIVL